MGTDTTTDKAYYQGWYSKNKEDLLQKRRKRYESDPEYRAKIRAAREASRKVGSRSKGREKQLVIGGTVVTVYSNSYVACRLGITTTALVSWESKGWIPTTTIEGTHRFYTYDQMVAIEQYYQSIKTGVMPKQEAIAIIFKGW